MTGLKRLATRSFLGAALALAGFSATAETLQENNAILFQQLAQVHRLSAGELAAVKKIFARGGVHSPLFFQLLFWR